jgi:hypothetical protein
MKHRSLRWYVFPLFILLTVVLFFSASCLGSQSTPVSAFYDSGSSDLTMTGTQFGQYVLFRFNTASSERTLTTPSAADIVSRFSSPVVGSVSVLAVTADGSNIVTLMGGPNVTVKPSASTVAGNTTLTLFCELDNVTKGSEAVTFY